MRGDREQKIEGDRGASADGLALPGRALTALTTSALAIPGIVAPARADTPIEQASSAYAFSFYKEDNLVRNRRFVPGGGSSKRYEVLTHQFEVDLPVSKRMDAGVDFLYEKMSGASPWYVQASGNERVQVMSGATIDDTRYDLSGNLNYYMDNAKDTLIGGVSKEQDYLSVHGGIGTERSFSDKNTTLSTSASFSYDWITPNNPQISQGVRPTSGEKWSLDLFGGLTQLLTRASAIQTTISYKHSDGYLSDPYKAITTVDPNQGLLSDNRPSSKDQASLLLRYRHHIEPIAASVHFDYRFYADTWQVTSHTFEVAWHQNLFGWLTLIPGARYYSQSKAEFYDTILPRVENHRSSDFRLSPYGAVSWKIKAEASLEDLLDYHAGSRAEAFGFSGGLDLFLSLSYERYISDGAFAIKSVSARDEAPALVNFQIVAFTLTGRF